jgi:hypothetical protein
MNEVNNPPGRSRPQKPRRLKPRAACRQTGVLVLLVAASMAFGCGSGGGGSKGTPAPPSINGTATKGNISGGVVIVEQLREGGVVKLATTTTDANGDYSITLPLSFDARAGAVRIRIIPGKVTMMTCDAPAGCSGIEFGRAFSLPEGSGFEMVAIVNAQPGDTEVSVQVTPFSHLAASGAGALGDDPGAINGLDIAIANATISQLVGFNILETEATDLASIDEFSSTVGIQYALMNASIATIMFSGSDPVADLLAGLAELATAMADGALERQPFGGGDEFTIDALQTAVAETLAGVAALDPSDFNVDVSEIEDAGDNVSDYQENIIDVAFADGLSTADITVVENQTDVESAKELIGTVRTFMRQIESDVAEPLEAFGVDAEAVEAIFSDESSQILQMVGDALDSGASAIDDRYPDGILEALNADPDQSITVVQPVTNGAGESLGSLTVTMSEESDGYSLTVSGVLEEDESAVVVTDLTVISSGADDFNALDDSVADFLTTDGINLLLSGTVSNGSTSLELSETNLSGTLTETTTFGGLDGELETELKDVIASLNFSGGVVLQTNGAEFEGNLRVESVRLEDEAVRGPDARELPLSLDLISLDGTFTLDTRSFEAEVTFDITGARAFDSFSFVTFDSDPYFGIESEDVSDSENANVDATIASFFTIPPSTTITFVDFYYDYWNGFLGFAAFSDESFSEIEVPADALDGLIEDLLTGQYGAEPIPDSLELGYFYYYLQAGFGSDFYADGWVSLPDFETSDSYLQGEVRIETDLTLPGLPDGRIVATLERDSLDGGSVTITPFYGTETYSFEFVSDDLRADEVAVTLTITDPLGGGSIVATTTDVAAAKFMGTVTVDGSQVATISEGSGVPLVRYVDGRFESLY